MKLIIVNLAILLAFAIAHEGVSPQSALRKALFDGYDKEVNPNHRVTTKVNLYVNDLKLDFHDEILTVNGWSVITWNDSRLTWNPDDFGGSSKLLVNSKFVWIPDITLFNAAQPSQRISASWEENVNVVINSSGSILFVPPSIMKTHCNVNYENWPWGDQNCTVTMGSWTHDKTSVDIEGWNAESGSCTDTSAILSNRLEIIDTGCERAEKIYGEEKYPYLNINLQFKFTEKFIDNKLEKP